MIAGFDDGTDALDRHIQTARDFAVLTGLLGTGCVRPGLFKNAWLVIVVPFEAWEPLSPS